ncbi:F0F1 ATP synthase subunit delta [Candidatus Kuenenbacteria bacterium]|nr:F0F1 ATP synthase subunit delta [Candidatus Kuenenbacteria bacterium]
MKVKTQEYVQLFYKLLSESEEPKQVIGDFLQLIYANGDLGKIEGIIRSFEGYYQKMEDVSVARVETVKPLDDDVRNMIKGYIKKIKPGVKRVEIEEVVEPNILGGVKITVDDILFDGTIKKQLINLKNSLIQ